VVVQVLLVVGAWWLFSGGPPSETSSTSSSLAVQRLAELQSNVAARALASSDQAALDAVIQQALAWPEVAYLSVEDQHGKILAHTDSTKVGSVWNDRLASRMRATIKATYQEAVAPLGDSDEGKGSLAAGRLRLGYLLTDRAAVTPRADWPYAD